MNDLDLLFNEYSEESGTARMNLQFFADGGGDGSGGDGAGDGGADGEGNGQEGKEGGGNKDTTPTLSELLSGNEGYQSEYESKLKEETEKAVEEALKKEREKADQKLSEGEKLSKMSEEEKAAYLLSQKEKELADKEADLNRRELKASAIKTLADKNIPVELAECLVYTDAEACNASITALQKAFVDAVKNAVEDRLKGGAPMKKAPEGQEKEDESVINARQLAQARTEPNKAADAARKYYGG